MNPVTDKHTIVKILPQHDLMYVSTSMQGWRISMEDVHTVETNIPEFLNYSFFGVYDGHCGKKTAEYIGTNLHLNIFKKIHEFGEENIEEAIKIAFMQTDSDWKADKECDYNPNYNSISFGSNSSACFYDPNYDSTYNIINSIGSGSGSTAITAVITPSQIVHIGNAGDSRAVMSVSGLAISSKDHKPTNVDEEKRIIQAGGFVGGFTREDCEGCVCGDLSVSRGFGDFFYKSNVEKKPEEQMIIAYPDVESYKIETETDFLVLASDGIWDCKTSQEVIDFIYEDVKMNKDLSKACENLMDNCLAKNLAEDGCDNMTIIVIGFLHGLKKEKWLERISKRLYKNTSNDETKETVVYLLTELSFLFLFFSVIYYIVISIIRIIWDKMI